VDGPRALDETLLALVKWRKTSTHLVPEWKSQGFPLLTPLAKEKILAWGYSDREMDFPPDDIPCKENDPCMGIPLALEGVSPSL
jgi:hypothetical protein